LTAWMDRMFAVENQRHGELLEVLTGVVRIGRFRRDPAFC
jgi:hypothetical protein